MRKSKDRTKEWSDEKNSAELREWKLKECRA